MRTRVLAVLVALAGAGCAVADAGVGARDEELSASTRRLLGTWKLEALEPLNPFARLVIAEVAESSKKSVVAHVAMVPYERRNPLTNRFATVGSQTVWGPLEPVIRVPGALSSDRGSARLVVDAPGVGTGVYALGLEPDGAMVVTWQHPSNGESRARFTRVKAGGELSEYLPNDMFVARDAASTTLSDHRIVIVGGYSFVSGRGAVTGQTLIYDPRRDSWQRGPEAGPVGEAGLYAQGERLFLFGGWFPHTSSAAGMGVSLPLFTTDLASSAPTWSMLPKENLDYIVSAHTGAMLGARVFQFGGTLRQHIDGVAMAPSERVSLFETTTSTWSRRAPMPTARTGHCAVALDERRVLVVGGEPRQPDFASGPRTWVLGHGDLYDAQADRWLGATAAMPLPVTMPSCVRLADGRVAVLGGRTSAPGPSVTWSEVHTVQVFDPHTGTWTFGPAYPAVMPMGAMYERGYHFEHGLLSVSARPAVGVGPDGTVYLFEADSVLRWKPGSSGWMRPETVGCWGSLDDAPGCGS